MSEELEPYKYSPPIMEESWGYRFAFESRRFIYLSGRVPTEAFISNDLIDSMRQYVSSFSFVKDEAMSMMEDGSFGVYDGVTIYSTSKPGITFA